jgi:hypothetical protein
MNSTSGCFVKGDSENYSIIVPDPRNPGAVYTIKVSPEGTKLDTNPPSNKDDNEKGIVVTFEEIQNTPNDSNLGYNIRARYFKLT